MPTPKSITEYFVLLTILLLPWYVVRGSFHAIPFTLLEISILATLALWVGELILTKRKPRLPNRYWLLLLGLFLAASTVSLWWSGDHRAALGVYKAYIIEPVLLGLVVADLVANRRDFYKWIFGALFLVGWQIFILCVLQKSIGWPVFAPAEQAQGRSSAVFNTGNAVGLLVGPIAALALPWLEQRSGWRNWWQLALAASFAATVVAIGLSKSRGAMLGIVAVVGVSSALYLVRKRGISVKLWKIMTTTIVGIYILATVGFMWWFNHPPKVANPYTRPGFTTLTVRACTWEGTVKGLDEQPLQGFGLANFTSTYLKHYTCDAEPLVYPHNFVLNAWTELGLLGLLSMVGIVAYWLWSVYPVTDNREMALVKSGLYLVMVYWLIHGLVDVPYFKNDLSAAWWILAGMVIGLSRWNSDKATD